MKERENVLLSSQVPRCLPPVLSRASNLPASSHPHPHPQHHTKGFPEYRDKVFGEEKPGCLHQEMSEETKNGRQVETELWGCPHIEATSSSQLPAYWQPGMTVQETRRFSKHPNGPRE